MPFFRRSFHWRSKTGKAAIGVITILAVGLVALIRFSGQSEDLLPQPSIVESTNAMDIGLTYLPLTPNLAAYYSLGVEEGVLITEVTPDTPAAKAGLQAGDIILSYNGVRLEAGASLLGLMMACPAGNRIALEVRRANSTRVVELTHTQR